MGDEKKISIFLQVREKSHPRETCDWTATRVIEVMGRGAVRQSIRVADATRQTFNLDSRTARKYYLDSETLDGRKLLAKMADVLRPKKG